MGARKEARAWQEKYDELIRREKRGDWTGGVASVEGQMHEVGHGGWKPDELDGRLVHEVAGGMG